MGDNNEAERMMNSLRDEMEQEDDGRPRSSGYRVPSPQDVRATAPPSVATKQEDFDEDSFLNEELVGDETRIVTSQIRKGIEVLPDPQGFDDSFDDEDSFDDQETRIAQTGVRRTTLRPIDEELFACDDIALDECEEETRVCEEDLFSGPTNRPAPPDKKTA